MKPTLNEQLARMQKLAGIINESQTNEGYDEFQRADKGSKDITAKDKGEEEVYGAGVEKGEEIEKKKMTKEQLKAQIKEMILAELTEDSLNENSPKIGDKIAKLTNLNEAKKDEEVEDVTVDDTEVVDAPASDMMAGESTEVSGIQSNLQAAYAEAKALGDEKLITQIANTITYFTKAHILDTAPVNESQINEVLQNDDLIYDRMSDMDQEQLVSMILSFAESNPSVTLVDYLNNEFGYDDESDNDDNYDDNMDVYDDSYPDMAEAKKAKNKLDQINENMFPMLKRILR